MHINATIKISLMKRKTQKNPTGNSPLFAFVNFNLVFDLLNIFLLHGLQTYFLQTM